MSLLSPCGGSKPPVLGGCFQYYDKNALSVSLCNNTTAVVDYASTGWNSNGIPPYIRPWSDANEECFTVLAGDDDCQAIAHGSGNGNPSEDYPTTCSFIACTGSNVITLNQGPFWNCFARTTASINMSQCHKLGFKNLVARKNWVGRPSYMSPDNDGFFDSFSWCGECGIKNYVSASDPVKYRTITGTAYVAVNGFDPDGNPYSSSASATASCTVNRYTSQATSTYSVSGDSSLTSTALDALGTIGNSDVSYLLTVYQSYLEYLENPTGYPDTVTQTGPTAYSLAYAGEATETINMAGGSMTFSYGVGNDGDPVRGFQIDNIQYTPTSVTRTYGEGSFCYNFGSQIIVTAACSLSDEYDATTFMGDFLALLNRTGSAEWNLANDIIYPWRYTSNSTAAPLISYDEKPIPDEVALGSITTPGFLWTGQLVGQPNVSASTAPFWNGKQLNYQECNGSPSLYGYGDVSGQNGIPNAATQWSDMLQTFNPANNLGIPQGGYWYFDTTNQTMWAGIYAELYLNTRPSYNFDRPCGAIDRFALNGQANCIDSISGTTLALDNSTINNFTGSNVIVIAWGTNTSSDGLWQGSSAGAYSFNLTQQLISGSELPRNLWGYASSGSSFGNGMLLGTRWVSTTAPICGRVDIDFLTQTTPVTMSLSTPQYGFIPGDSLVINGVTGSTDYNGNTYTVARMTGSFTQFILVGSSASLNKYKKGGYVESPLSRGSYTWNSTSPRQNFVVGNWDNNNLRAIGEYYRLQAQSASIAGGCVNDMGNTVNCTSVISPPTTSLQPIPPFVYSQSCIPLTPCTPSVLCAYISGTTPTFGNYSCSYLPTSIMPDSKYGGMLYQAWYIQEMIDPLYIAPPCPCQASPTNPSVFNCQCTWQMDDGTCHYDVPEPPCTQYYAAADRYEAILAVASGSPALPVGCSFTGSYAYLVAGTLTHDPWGLWLNEMNCVCSSSFHSGSGRFADYYLRNGVTCDPNLFGQDGQ